MRKKVDEFSSKIPDPAVKQMFLNCFYSTLDTTTEMLSDGTCYVFTGDIPAMWLRDSSVQVTGYLPYCNEDQDVKALIKGLIKRQMRYIIFDPYSNAFKKEPAEGGHKDKTDFQHDIIWERKFEVDSLCYPLWLINKYYQISGDESIFDPEFYAAYDLILKTFKIEQDHDELSPYYFMREGHYSGDSLDNQGKGAKSRKCGLIWSAFRPSDDKCKYHYLIPSNMMAVSVYRDFEEIFAKLGNTGYAKQAGEFAREVDQAIKDYAVFEHKKYGKMYSFETDGYGNHNLMDDANVPSLLSLPYLGYCKKDDTLYLNTRNFILSGDNPYYYKGTAAKGVGSPHTPENYIWHIAIVMQMLTSGDEKEINECFETLIKSDGGRGVMHESFDKDDPKKFTREWFAWANTLFAIAVVKKYGK